MLLSSHILAEVETLCDRVSIIRNGRTVETGTIADLRHFTRTSVDAVLVHPTIDLAALEGVHGLQVPGDRVRFDVDSSHLDAAIARLSEAGIRTMSCHPPTLEELFLRHYGDQAGAASS